VAVWRELYTWSQVLWLVVIAGYGYACLYWGPSLLRKRGVEKTPEGKNPYQALRIERQLMRMARAGDPEAAKIVRLLTLVKRILLVAAAMMAVALWKAATA